MKPVLGFLIALAGLWLFALASSILFKITLGAAFGVMVLNCIAYLVLALGAGLMKG